VACGGKQYAPCLRANSVQQVGSGRAKQNLFPVALDRDDLSQNDFRWFIILLAGIAARHNPARHLIPADDSMKPEACATARQHDVAPPRLAHGNRRHLYRVAIQHVRLHALSACLKPHPQSTL
jgi:hypothetical protein